MGKDERLVERSEEKFYLFILLLLFYFYNYFY